jgi:prepilin-type N-terminal cleavage/methylation domain-containing protein
MNTQRQQQNSSLSRDGGYTIIESLVAMIVVSVLMIAIAPVMAFSVATRVQARRTELATQAARSRVPRQAR